MPATQKPKSSTLSPSQFGFYRSKYVKIHYNLNQIKNGELNCM